MEKWFDSAAYMQNKLAQMQATDPAYTMTQLVAAFAAAGFVGEEGYFNHFMQFGAAEEVAPNAYFNADEYYAAKAAQFYGDKFDGSEFQIAQVKALIHQAGMNAWTHYQQFGSTEGVNPSNAFDASDYCAAKADAMNAAGQKDPDGNAWTAESIAKAIDDAGMSVLEHYMTYAGTGEGEVAAGTTFPVPEDEQVVVSKPGETFFLTKEIDNVKGTAGDDVFKAPDGTMGAFDTVDGGAGNDTLEVYENQKLAGTYTNIENLVIVDAKDANGGDPIDLSSFSGSFTLKGSSDTDVTVKNVAGQKLVLDGTGAITLNATMTDAQTSANLVSQNAEGNVKFSLMGKALTDVNLVTDGANADTIYGTDTIKNVNVTATDDAEVTLENMNKLENVTVAGAGAVDLNGLSASVKTVDATANAGGVTVDLTTAVNTAFKGGAGDDVITVAKSNAAHDLGAGDDVLTFTEEFAAKGTVEGGEGTDTISVDVAQLDKLAAEIKAGDITGFEALAVSDQVTGGVDMADFSGIDYLVLGNGLAADQTISNMQSGSTLVLTADAEQAFAVTVAGADKATDDTLNIVLSNASDLDAKTVTVKNVETINIVADDDDETVADATHTMTLSADKATTVKVSGDADLALTLTGSAAVKTIDASESTGDVEISDVLKGVTFTGGAGDDVVTLGAGNTVTGGAGDDTFNVETDTVLNDRSVITDFGAGDTIVMGNSVNGSGTGNALGNALVVNDPRATLEDYVNAATQTAESVAWFQYEGNTYVVVNDDTKGFDASADFIVQLSGSVDLSDAVMAGGELTLA